MEAGRPAWSSPKAWCRLGGDDALAETRGASPAKVLLHQFASPLIYLLLGAAATSAFLRQYKDAAVIGAVLLINAVIGFVQEHRAATPRDADEERDDGYTPEGETPRRRAVRCGAPGRDADVAARRPGLHRVGARAGGVHGSHGLRRRGGGQGLRAAGRVAAAQREAGRTLRAKHPALASFVEAATTALVREEIEESVHVGGFPWFQRITTQDPVSDQLRSSP